VNLTERNSRRTALRNRIRDLHSELLDSKAQIIALDKKRSDLLQRLEAEGARVQQAAEAGEGIDDSILLNLQREIATCEGDVEHKEVRIVYLRKQLGQCRLRPHTIDNQLPEEEEDESELTADELIARVSAMRKLRNNARVQRTEASAERISLVRKDAANAKLIARLQALGKAAAEKSLINPDRPLTDFPPAAPG
jgi:chromosome segregation ATPase